VRQLKLITKERWPRSLLSREPEPPAERRRLLGKLFRKG
jgi:hypothetical protein